MKQAFKTIFSEQDFRRIIREEVQAVLSGADQQIAGGGDDGFLNMDQVADLLKLSKSHLYKLTASNEIPFKKTGKKLLFKKSEVLEWYDKK